jgi:hypothetical protein
MWIYLGEYADRNAVINALVNDYGVDRKTAKKYVVTGVNANGTANTSTHWRIESTGTEHGSSDLNHRVMIDNDKNTRETTAYSITAYKPLSVKLSIQTETEAGNLIAGKSKAFGKSATQCKYGVYYSASSAKKDKNRVATVTLNGMGKGSVKIPSDKYGSVYIKELVTPTGFKISGNVIKLTSESTVITQEKAVGSISFNQKFSDGKSGYVKYECVNTNTGKVVATKKVKITNGKAAVKFDGLPVYGYKNATASYGVYASERIKYTVRETYAKSSDGVPYNTAGKEFSVTLSKYRKGKMATGYTYVFKLGHTVINYPESGNLRLKTTFKNAEGKTVTPTSAQKSAVVFVLKNSSGKLVSKTALRKNLCKQINCDKKR